MVKQIIVEGQNYISRLWSTSITLQTQSYFAYRIKRYYDKTKLL